MGGSVHTTKINTEALVATSKKNWSEVNTQLTKYMVMSRDQHAGQNQNIKIGNKSLERVKQFRYLGTTQTNQNCIHEEIRNRPKSGNACYNLVQNLVSSVLLLKNIKITIYITIILPALLHGCET
jgi:hypothetical protein